jgi:23S rRNA (guanosine2251-2'-O)-methyltransferase
MVRGTRGTGGAGSGAGGRNTGAGGRGPAAPSGRGGGTAGPSRGAGRGGVVGGGGAAGWGGAGGGARGAGPTGGAPRSAGAGTGRPAAPRVGGGAPRGASGPSGGAAGGRTDSPRPSGRASFGSAGRAPGSRPQRSGPSRGNRGSTAMGAPIRPRAAKGLGGDQVEGRQAVRELLLANKRRVREVWMADGTDDSPILAEIEQLATEYRVPVRVVTRDQLFSEARTEAPQGVLAFADEVEEANFEEMLKPRNGRLPFLLFVDQITDPQNLGALLRSADGAGITGVVLPRHRAVHVTATVTKAAAGAVERVPMALVGGLPTAMLDAKKAGAWIVGLDADGADDLYALSHLGDEPLVVVIGAEGDGLSRLVRARCDSIARINTRGILPSLNASVAGAVAMFEMGRHRK